ncbi:MAG: 4-hydroxybenzoate 3-monooxygenase [Ornithinimicrobium sp.]|uniref:4-hydroxybenzoate 3-monooxygenase n=1 Tax=Ornithinimicrobium sp. TaxID=1977084 RepID=UPI0026DF1A3E|nr:4-hydroxybenzoate 3-monooxygenase [Ornithinimicrobium sp.]MDO5739975.1 4-hydroxybenzoate 3-monooxygenase [Ornithinimicrobium sp.]
MSTAEVTRSTTTVGIVGGGPAGLMLSHLLHRNGIDSVVIDNRTRETIEHTNRAGILEAGSVRLLTETGVSDRIFTDGYRHEGIELRFGGAGHRIDFEHLVGESVWLYPQTDVFIDLADARARDGGNVHFGVSDSSVAGVTSDAPTMSFVDAEGQHHEVTCDYLVGADGSHSICRAEIPREVGVHHFREYPFAWFGIMTEAAMSAPELIYSHSDHGFALISQRTPTLQRMYFQCDPNTDPTAWSDDQVWHELDRRTEVPGFVLAKGPITEKVVLRFRSFVCQPMRYGHLFLAGDAAHTVPPTGAKGLNLALMDVKVLAEVLDRAVNGGQTSALEEYSPRVLERVWKAQHFSYWMTSMLHTLPGEFATFDTARQVGELNMVVQSTNGRRFLAEAYTGWPEKR